MQPQLIKQIVAIDGPAGAGKSTVARSVADALGFAYLDTGAMYRAATWNAMQQGVDLDDSRALAGATRRMKLELDEHDGKLRVVVNGQDISNAIRTPEVTRCIAKLDHNAEVRAHLVDLQREIGAQRPTVAEGRDMGTVVFPAAKCKIYLDASLDERARRRARDFDSRGISYDADALADEIRARDEKDSTRAIAPLRRAPDAVLIDTSKMNTDEVIAAIVDVVKSRW